MFVNDETFVTLIERVSTCTLVRITLNYRFIRFPENKSIISVFKKLGDRKPHNSDSTLLSPLLLDILKRLLK